MDKFILGEQVTSIIFCKYHGSIGTVVEVIHEGTNVEAYKVRYTDGAVETYDGKDLQKAIN